MSLLRYRVDYSKLSPDEVEDLFRIIDEFSFNGFHPDYHARIGEFYLDDSVDVSTLRIPDSCQLSHLQ